MTRTKTAKILRYIN